MALSLGSSLCWGVADFFGSLQSRRLPALSVVVWSQAAGGLVLLVVVTAGTIAGGEVPPTEAVLTGGLAGMFGGLALALFYRGLAIGVISIVAPISACGAIVPVVVALIEGEIPHWVAIGGIAVAIAGVVLVSISPGGSGAATADRRAALGLAFGAAIGFGLFIVLVDRGSEVSAGSPLWVILGARAGSLTLLLALATLSRRLAPWPGERIAPVALIGILDTLANVLIAFASTLGNLGVVAVLGSLYPVTTVLLARALLNERLSGRQSAGVTLALAGVVLMSGG